MSSHGIGDTLKPLITCGALALLGLYLYAYQKGRHETLDAPPCSVSYKVSEADIQHDEQVSLDALMRRRDPFLHYVSEYDKIPETTQPMPDGPQRHPILETLLKDLL
jgi:hypothetical protein